MAKKLYLILSGAIFLLVAVFHLLRLLNHWPIVVGPRTIPFVLSYVGLPASMAYCAWATWLLCAGEKPR
jgi:hypothetical protein